MWGAGRGPGETGHCFSLATVEATPQSPRWSLEGDCVCPLATACHGVPRRACCCPLALTDAAVKSIPVR